MPFKHALLEKYIPVIPTCPELVSGSHDYLLPMEGGTMKSLEREQRSRCGQGIAFALRTHSDLV